MKKNERADDRIPIIIVGRDDKGDRQVTRVKVSPRGYHTLVMIFGPAAVMREEDCERVARPHSG